MLLKSIVTSSLFTCRNFGNIFVYATHDCPRHVLNISAVCQLWRDAALKTPMLWTTLELTTRFNRDNHINSWIERARSYPLSLVIRNRNHDHNHVNTALTLLPNHKWKSISLDSVTSTLLILQQLEFSNLEMLESFSLKPRFFAELSLPDALRYAPKLKTLLLDAVLHTYEESTISRIPRCTVV
jgi:hypothetical protein